MQEKPFDCMHLKKCKDEVEELYYSESSQKYGYVPQLICAARVSVSAFEPRPPSLPPSGHGFLWITNIKK